MAGMYISRKPSSLATLTLDGHIVVGHKSAVTTLSPSSSLRLLFPLYPSLTGNPRNPTVVRCCCLKEILGKSLKIHEFPRKA